MSVNFVEKAYAQAFKPKALPCIQQSWSLAVLVLQTSAFGLPLQLHGRRAGASLDVRVWSQLGLRIAMSKARIQLETEVVSLVELCCFSGDAR